MKPPVTPVIIAPYDLHWPELFEIEKSQISNRIGFHRAAIEHIGSTAVPGLGAKPIIDIMIGVDTLSIADECIEPLENIGYRYVPEFEESIPDRRFLWKGAQGQRTHHIHMVETGGDFWKRHLLFRDYLRMHSDEAEKYYALKTELAGTFGTDRDGYTDAKSTFIETIVEKAGIAEAGTND